MTTIIEIIGLSVFVNMLAYWFEPIQGIKYKMLHKLPLWMQKPFICCKCGGLWFGLAWFGNPFLGAATSLTSYLIENLIYFIDIKRNEEV